MDLKQGDKFGDRYRLISKAGEGRMEQVWKARDPDRQRFPIDQPAEEVRRVPARAYCERLAEAGLLCKENYHTVLRLSPPLVISKEDAAWAAARISEAFES